VFSKRNCRYLKTGALLCVWKFRDQLTSWTSALRDYLWSQVRWTTGQERSFNFPTAAGFVCGNVYVQVPCSGTWYKIHPVVIYSLVFHVLKQDWSTRNMFRYPKFDFPLSKTYTPPVGHTQPSVQWCRGLFCGMKGPGREGNHSRPCGAEIKNAWGYVCTLLFAFMTIKGTTLPW